MADFIPDRDNDFQTWLTNFLQVAEDKREGLGLTEKDISDLIARSTAFSRAVNGAEATRSAFDSATTTKKNARASAEELARSLARKVQNHEGTSDSHRAALRITVRDSSPSSNSPLPPTRLVVTGDASGRHQLKWDRVGNGPGTQFVVEARVGSSTSWILVDVVTAARLDHTGQKPGVAIVYRVRARRRGITSEPSNEAALYL